MTDTQPRRAEGSSSREHPGGHEQVSEIQRARILSAMVEVACEHGYLGAAVAPVVARAGVSRRTFYELFDGREDCFLAACEWGVSQVREVVVEAYGTQRSWRERVRHAVAALLGFLDAEPELARVLVIEALGAGRLVLQRRGQLLEELTSALDADAPRAGRTGGKPLLTAEGVVGGAFSVIHARLITHSGTGEQRMATDAGEAPSPLIGLHGQLMALIALPYLGPRAAGEEFTRAAPDVPRREVARSSDEGGMLLKRLNMRLTYRTVRCLLFIGEHPGCSNREIAHGADMADEGQTSKLLSRLVRLELIANSQAHGPGHPNRWTLTPHGTQVLNTVQTG